MIAPCSWLLLVCIGTMSAYQPPASPAVAPPRQPTAATLAFTLTDDRAWAGPIELDAAIASSLSADRAVFSIAKTPADGGRVRAEAYSRLLLLAAVTEGFPDIVGPAVPASADRELLARAIAGSAKGPIGQRRILTLVALARAFESARALSGGGIDGETRDAKLAEIAWLAASVGSHEYANAAHDAIVSIGFKRSIAGPALVVLKGWYESEEALFAEELFGNDVQAACVTYGAALAERWSVASRLRERVRSDSPQRERLDGLLAFRATVSTDKEAMKIYAQAQVSGGSEQYARSFAGALAAWGGGRPGEDAAGQHLATLLPGVVDAEARGVIFTVLSDWLAMSKARSAISLMALLKNDAAVPSQARLAVARAMLVSGRTDVETVGVDLAQLEQLLSVRVPREDVAAAEWHNAQLGVLAAATKSADARLAAAKVLRGYSWGAHQNRVVAVGGLAAQGATASAESMFDTVREGLQATNMCLVALAAGSFRQGNQASAAGALQRVGDMQGISEISRRVTVDRASEITIPAGLWATQICFAERYADGTAYVSDAWIRSGMMWGGTVPFPFSAKR